MTIRRHLLWLYATLIITGTFAVGWKNAHAEQYSQLQHEVSDTSTQTIQAIAPIGHAFTLRAVAMGESADTGQSLQIAVCGDTNLQTDWGHAVSLSDGNISNLSLSTYFNNGAKCTQYTAWKGSNISDGAIVASGSLPHVFYFSTGSWVRIGSNTPTQPDGISVGSNDWIFLFEFGNSGTVPIGISPIQCTQDGLCITSEWGNHINVPEFCAMKDNTYGYIPCVKVLTNYYIISNSPLFTVPAWTSPTGTPGPFDLSGQFELPGITPPNGQPNPFAVASSTFSGSDLSQSANFCNGAIASASDTFGIARSLCTVVGFLFIPSKDSVQSIGDVGIAARGVIPFSYLFDLQSQWASVSANGAGSIPSISITTDLGVIGTKSFALFSAGTIDQYLSDGLRTTMRTILAAVLWLMLGSYMWHRVKSNV